MKSLLQKCIQIFKQRGHDIDVLKTLPEDELIKIIGNYEGLVIRSATKVRYIVILNTTSTLKRL